MAKPAATQNGRRRFGADGGGAQDLDSANAAVLGNADDTANEDDPENGQGGGDDDETNTDELNDNANGDETDTGVDDDAEGGEGDAEGAPNPNPRDVVRRGSGRPAQKPLEKAAGEELLTVMDAGEFTKNLAKAIDFNTQNFLLQAMPQMFEDICGPQLRALRTENVALRKAVEHEHGINRKWREYFDERTDDVEARAESIEKAMNENVVPLVKAMSENGLVELINKPDAAAGTPNVEPLVKANDAATLEAAQSGTVLEPGSGGGETAPKKILRLMKAAEGLQEKTHQAVKGLTDMTLAVENAKPGEPVPVTLIKALEAGVSEAEEYAKTLD